MLYSFKSSIHKLLKMFLLILLIAIGNTFLLLKQAIIGIKMEWDHLIKSLGGHQVIKSKRVYKNICSTPGTIQALLNNPKVWCSVGE